MRTYALAVMAVISLAPRLAAADEPDKNTCADAYEKSQRLRKLHELKAARSELVVCSSQSCPTWVKRDCVPWLAEVESAMPSIVVVARDGAGAVRTNVRVVVDGVTVTDRASREAITVDPGEHVVAIDADGAQRIEQRVSLTEGDREHRIDVTLMTLEKPVVRSRIFHEEPVAKERPVPPLSIALGAVGVVALGVGGYFQISGMNARADLFHCMPRCTSADVDDARRSEWVGNVVLGVGIVSIAAAAILYLTRPGEVR